MLANEDCRGTGRSSISMRASKLAMREGRRVIEMASVVVLALAIAMSMAVTEGTTDATDAQYLLQLRENIGGTSKLPSWVGDDPCGSNWEHIVCEGSSVSIIALQNTDLTGELPPALNRLQSLQNIALQGNNFSGPLPSLSGLASLKYAFLNGQSFSSIPDDFFQGLSSLIVLALDGSSLNESSGGWSLPSDVSSMTKLTNLSLTSTFLSGSLPEFLGSMPALQNLHLAYNYLTGTIPASLSSANLLTLQLNNQLSSTLLSGSIDPVGSIPPLKQLWLQGNAFSGTIPPGLGLLVSLQDCRLNDNQLVGPIPTTFASSTSLSSFSVRHNMLDGPIPKIPSVDSANYTFDRNYFCSTEIDGSCAPEVNALLSFLGGVGYPPLLAQTWSGNDPCSSWSGITCSASTKKVITINLSNYNLTGSISTDLANLTSLAILVLSNNNLTGTVPASLARLHSLRQVSLQFNNLDGPVPSLPGVALNVTGNPNIGKIQPLPSPSSPKSGSGNGNGTLSGPPPGAEGGSLGSGGSRGGNSSGTPSTDVPAVQNSHSRKTGPLIGAVVGSICLVFAAGILFLFLVKKRKKYDRTQSSRTILLNSSGGRGDPKLKITVGSRVADVSDSQSPSGSGSNDVQVVDAGNLVISIQVLRNVTNNFSKENVLGKGGFGVVYKGELDDGTKIAVKRMEASVVSSKGLSEFQSEIAVLTKVRHRHLVALLGYCIDGNERLLVYEYMPLGPLSQHLFDFSKLGLTPLSWKRRLSIALDVARGMEYLHGLAQTSFIHRDLKPSNILLGDDYRAKVSDFGLVKLASEDKFSVETRLAGTFGYLAPEYAVTGRVTTKSDVFSFGVVLMELITGRKALDETQPEESMHLVTWFRKMSCNKDDFLRAIDGVLEVTDESIQSIRSVAELAGYCTMREAWQRPDMGHAVNVLSPLVEQWKPTDLEFDDGCGIIDLDMTLPQALKRWQAFEGTSSSASDIFSASDLENTNGSMPCRPAGFAESFTSTDGR